MHPRAAMRPTAPDHASLPRWASALPRVLQLWTLPPCQGGIWCCHMSYDSRPRSLVKMGSGAATCPVAPDLTSWQTWAPTPPHVSRLWTPLPS
jgi:hypothetical protein